VAETAVGLISIRRSLSFECVVGGLVLVGVSSFRIVPNSVPSVQVWSYGNATQATLSQYIKVISMRNSLTCDFLFHFLWLFLAPFQGTAYPEALHRSTCCQRYCACRPNDEVMRSLAYPACRVVSRTTRIRLFG
jgi:hypothetical protein